MITNLVTLLGSLKVLVAN